MNDVMVDLETLGRRPGCAILSIGAVMFSIPEVKLGTGFYANVDTASCVAAGLTLDPDTVAWWKKQHPDAIAALKADRLPLREALVRFGNYMEEMGAVNDRKVWGNGPSFDNAILGHAYEVLGMPQPWPFWGDRCFRTIKGMYAAVPMDPKTGTHHNAAHDAIHQAKHILKIKQSMLDKRRPNA